MYSQEKEYSDLAKILSTFDYVFMDTCSTMNGGFPQFMDTLVGSKKYWKEGLRVIIPAECVEELEKHARNTDRRALNTRIDAQRALNIINHAKKKHHVIHIGKKQKQEQQKKENHFADPIFCANATVLRIQYRLLFITEDGDLTKDLLSLNDFASQMGKPLSVMKINKNGELEGKIVAFTPRPKERVPLRPKVPEQPKPEPSKPAEKKPANEENTAQNQPAKDKNLPVVHKQQQANLPAKKVESTPKAPKAWFEFGPSPLDAFAKCCLHFGIMVRDPGVAYVPQVHGPADVTSTAFASACKDIDFKAADLKTEVTICGLQATIEKTERDFKVILLPPAPVPVTKPAEKPVAEPKPKAPKAKKVEQPAAEKPIEEAPKPKRKPAAKKAGPSKPAEEPKPAAEPQKTEEPKPAKKPAPKKTDFEKATAMEKRLNANLGNPNYPVEKKSKDIDSLIKLLDRLTDEERAQIKLTKEILLDKKAKLSE